MAKQASFREIRYNEKRQKILDNAAKLFAQKGYENVSLEEIAAKLKLNKASLYHYFKSKDEMFFLIQMQAIEQANVVLEKVLESEVSGSVYPGHSQRDSQMVLPSMGVFCG